MTTNGNQDARPGAAAYQQSETAIVRQGFGSHEMVAQRETQAVAAAAMAKSTIESRYVMAMRNPRDLMDFRARMLQHAKRPGFAALAEYTKPVGGGKVKGLGIRFVEAALQEYGNILPESLAVYEDDEKRIQRVSLTDLERNITYVEDVTVEKFVERRNSGGGEVIGERRNSKGEIVYKVRATEDDFANKLAAAVSKKLRNLGLRILPPDIVDEVKAACAAVRESNAKADPDADRKKLLDAFTDLRIMPSDLKEYLGHDVGTASPAEIEDLRSVYVAVRDGETTWKATMDARREASTGDAKPADPQADALKAKLAKAPEKDKAPTSKPAAVRWRPDNGGLSTKIGDRTLYVEQSGPDEFGWTVTDAQGEELGRGAMTTLDAAKAEAERVAAK